LVLFTVFFLSWFDFAAIEKTNIDIIPKEAYLTPKHPSKNTSSFHFPQQEQLPVEPTVSSLLMPLTRKYLSTALKNNEAKKHFPNQQLSKHGCHIFKLAPPSKVTSHFKLTSMSILPRKT